MENNLKLIFNKDLANFLRFYKNVSSIYKNEIKNIIRFYSVGDSVWVAINNYDMKLNFKFLINYKGRDLNLFYSSFSFQLWDCISYKVES